jgi:hypothetical protein
MKVDTATIRIKNRRCQEVIKVYQHGQQKD